MKRGKKYKMAVDKVEKGKAYTLADAIKLVRETATARFDETVELSCKLGVDPKKADQMVRGTTVLPFGTGRKVRVLVLTKGEKVAEAKEAGADMVGADEYIEKIKGGWTDIDAIVATPDMMGSVGRLGKLLGPKGLMPNPKSGTVTQNVAKAVKDLKAGKIEYRVDKTGNVHCGVGKLSFSDDQLLGNAKAFLSAIVRAKPTTAKGTYIKRATICSTMGPGITLDTSEILTLGR
ncbi:MAG: 50S ribosomal protein L1 [Candidatus Zixiibacteriota bacterium]|nr:MAG: 50S ribosomal protein L1 [candidate division Zixibacteria bacterium]